MCLISYRHNFICFQIPKTGSTSVYKLLDPFVDERLGHSTYIEAQEAIDKDFFAGARKFTIVRNHYRWLFSMYSYIKGNPAHHLHKEFKSFDEFIEKNKLGSQYDYIKDSEGLINVDLIRLEEIKTVLPKYLKGLGIRIKSIPHLNKSDNLIDKINEQIKEDNYGYYII